MEYNTPVIVVVGYDRHASLERILSSLGKAQYPQTNIKLVISIDKSKNSKVAEVAQNFHWDYGDKEILLQRKNLGLRKHILKCGDLALEYGAIILLEDDLHVSPYFYSFAQQSLAFIKDDEKIAGISLFTHIYNETSYCRFMPLEDGTDCFYMGMPSSWGQIWTRAQWAQFKEWYNPLKSIDEHVEVPSDVRNWSDQSWKKYFIWYLISEDKYFLYPRISLTTNCMEPGEHHKIKESRLHVPLLLEEMKFRFKSLDDSVAVYDSWCEIKPEKLVKMQPELASFDFVVDLYGEKELQFIDAEYILTTKKSSDPEKLFGLNYKPHEFNILVNNQGEEIALVKTNQCVDSGLNLRDRILFYYGIPRFIFPTADEQTRHIYKKYELILQQYQAIKNSMSWRITSPLRWVANALKIKQ